MGDDEAGNETDPAEEVLSTETLTAAIDLLWPLSSANRRRTIEAAMVFLGESGSPTDGAVSNIGSLDEVGGVPEKTTWMEKNDIKREQLDMVFHFHDDGTVDLLDAPGGTKKAKTVATYILTGLGQFLATGERGFSDGPARENCKTIGCFNAGNHANFVKSNEGAFTGDKDKGYTITNPGLLKGADLVRELTK